MYKRRRRIITQESVDVDSEKPRRSSLQVNLSYLSNATDSSDHDSFEQSRKNSPPNVSETRAKKPERMLPRIISIERHFNEENIFKDKILNENCSQLRDAILRKTKDLYDDPRCELIAKTEKVLQKDSQTMKITSEEILVVADATLLKSLNESVQKSPTVRVALGEDQQLTLSGTRNKNREFVSVNTMKSPRIETPRSSRIPDAALSSNRRSSIIQKRLFTDENNPEIMKTPNCSSSPILSGTSKKRAKILSRLNSSDLHEIPLTSSTIIDRNREQFVSQSVDNSPKYSSQDKRIVSMELTEVRGKILSTPWKVTTTTSTVCHEDNENSIPSTTRTSLNVNTSVDRTTQDGSKNRSRFRLPDSPCEKSQPELSVHETEGETSDETKKRGEEAKNDGNCKKTLSISIGSKRKKLYNVHSVFDDSVAILENTSLRDRLNAFPKPTSVRTENLRYSNVGEMSHVEGTPLPVSKSFMWKSQIKQGTFASNSHESPEKIVQPNDEVVKRKRGKQSEERHPALDSSESEVDPRPGNSSRESARLVTSETSSKSSKTGESLNNSKLSKKKKLYPLRGHSQLLTMTPVNTPTPQPKAEPKIITRRRKNLKWQKLKESQRTQRIQPVMDTDTETDDDLLTNATSQQEKPKKKTRKVLRKKIVMKPFSSSNPQKGENKRTRNLIDNERADSRRSSLTDYEFVEQEPRKKTTKQFLIVVTGFANGDKTEVKDIVKKLGKGGIESNVSRKTTHVVSTGVRTINLLKGILRGCWLVNLDWVLKSSEAGKWLNPEPFELEHYSASVKENRRERQLFGNAFMPELLSNCGLIYVAGGTNPSPPVLKDLIKTAGGQITENPKEAKITIGLQGLRENWILDSITTGKLQPAKQYRIKS